MSPADSASEGDEGEDDTQQITLTATSNGRNRRIDETRLTPSTLTVCLALWLLAMWLVYTGYSRLGHSEVSSTSSGTEIGAPLASWASPKAPAENETHCGDELVWPRGPLIWKLL